MDKDYIVDSWNYYLTIEQELAETSRFVEPVGQELVYSFEFARIIIISCVEVEALLKAICNLKAPNPKEQYRNMKQYKNTILNIIPEISVAKVYARRYRKDIYPFADWKDSDLSWWKAYNCIKHNRKNSIVKANYINAVTSVAAVYILNFYLAELLELDFASYESQYFSSKYAPPLLFNAPPEALPGFEKRLDEAQYMYDDEK